MSEEFNVNKITADVCTNLATSMAQKCFETFRKMGKDYISKSEIDLGNAFEEYLDFSYDNINSVKTLLYRDQGKPLYSFYECVGLMYEEDVIEAKYVKNVLEQGHFLIITGTGGIGKTIMLKHFYLDCINSTSYIPVLVSLRSANHMDITGKTILDIIVTVQNPLGFNDQLLCKTEN